MGEIVVQGGGVFDWIKGGAFLHGGIDTGYSLTLGWTGFWEGNVLIK